MRHGDCRVRGSARLARILMTTVCGLTAIGISRAGEPIGYEMVVASFRTGEWDYAGLFAIAADRDVAGRRGARKGRCGNQGL